MSYVRPRTVQVRVPGEFITALPRMARDEREETAYAALRPVLMGARRMPGEGGFWAVAQVGVELLEGLEDLAVAASGLWAGTGAGEAARRLARSVAVRRCAEDLRAASGVAELWSVVVVRPGLATVRLGPVLFRSVAEAMSVALMDVPGRSRPVGTTAGPEVYDDSFDYLSLLPLDAGALVVMMDEERDADHPGQEHGGGESFPDLWDRLRAQFGYEEALPVWRVACMLADGAAEAAGERV